MLAPDVDIQDGKGTIIISSEEGETDCEPVYILTVHYVLYYTYVCTHNMTLVCCIRYSQPSKVSS